MAWIIGVDEAGYGPNLGPLVMASVAYDVPAFEPEHNLWRTLRNVVRRAGDDGESRLIVDDSKRVYSTAKGLAELERSVCSILLAPHHELGRCLSLLGLVECLSDTVDELRRECWFHGNTALPTEIPRAATAEVAANFTAALHHVGTTQLVVRCDIVCPPRFNECVERWDSKAAILGLGLTEFIRFQRKSLADGRPLHFFVDKHGGRNFYSALLQHAFDDGMVLAEEEGNRRSVYRVLGCDREISFTFQPEADASHFCVALASMLCKYLREVLMREFNAFWLQHVPGIKPTAGYPGDATRFLAEIRGAMNKIGLADHAIWRSR